MQTARPTILQIIPELDTGGAELSTVEIATAVVRAGGRAIVLSEGGRLAAQIADAGGEVIKFPAATKNPLRMAANASAIAAIAHRENVDLIHARSRAPAWSALGAARRSGKPFVTTYHGAYRESGKLKAIYNSVMARGDVVIANSRFTANLVASRYSTPASRMVVIYRGVDVDRFAPSIVSGQRIENLRSEWGIKKDRRIVLHAARLTAWKGQENVVAAAAQLRSRFPDAAFVLAGDSQGREDYRKTIERRIADGGLQGYVRLVGHVADMPAAFAASHAAIVASIEPEAFGRAGAEAQAMCCPVVSTNIGAPPETIMAPPRTSAAERTGWLIPPDDAAATAQALAEALSLNDDERAAMGRRARAHVEAHFSQTTMQRSTLAVYDRLLGSDLERRFLSAMDNGSADAHR